MGKKIRGVKIKASDINKNTGRDITHTVNKIKANERKYTIILVIFFMTIFCFVGYISLRIKPIELLDLSANSNSSYISSSSNVVVLSEKDKKIDSEGLKGEEVEVTFKNATIKDINYKIVFIEDTELKKICKCSSEGFKTSDIRFSIDGKNVKKLPEEENVITTGFLEAGKTDSIKIRIWLDSNSNYTGHFHGQFKFKEIEDC